MLHRGVVGQSTGPVGLGAGLEVTVTGGLGVQEDTGPGLGDQQGELAHLVRPEASTM